MLAGNCEISTHSAQPIEQSLKEPLKEENGLEILMSNGRIFKSRLRAMNQSESKRFFFNAGETKAFSALASHQFNLSAKKGRPETRKNERGASEKHIPAMSDRFPLPSSSAVRTDSSFVSFSRHRCSSASAAVFIRSPPTFSLPCTSLLGLANASQRKR